MNTNESVIKELSIDSLLLFMTMATRADFDFEQYDDEGNPQGYILLKELGMDAAKRGNLTDLKKKRFLDFYAEEDADRKRRGMQGGWVTLLPKGWKLAEIIGIN